MTITKFGHSCFLVEEGGVRILFDPGMFSKGQNDLAAIDAVLVTHDHGDHLDMDSLKAIVTKSPDVQIYTTATVKALLEKEHIAAKVLTHGESSEVKGVSIEAVGEKYAILSTKMPAGENVGFIVAGRLFYPGDALTIPATPVEILALPAAAPWSKISEVIDYALAVKPRIAFPVHEAILAAPEMMFGMLGKFLGEEGIEFKVPVLHTPTEF